jgi:hypothetical protein
VRCNIAYSSVEACPAESTKRSRLAHTGRSGSKRRWFCHSAYVTGASAIGVPGWPEFAACTASLHRVRIVATASWSID